MAEVPSNDRYRSAAVGWVTQWEVRAGIKRWVERALGPVPSEIEEEGGIEGRMQRKRWIERLARPAEQGTQGFFGRLADRRPATLSLRPNIGR